jgi:hypothetical protein
MQRYPASFLEMKQVRDKNTLAPLVVQVPEVMPCICFTFPVKWSHDMYSQKARVTESYRAN